MRTAFHEGKNSQEEELSLRLALPTTRKLGFSLGADELFFTMTSEVYELLLEATKLDKRIAILASLLPSKAVSSYTESTLIDEIVLSNNIEGVHSSRREINEVLESLKEKDRSGRFFGLVQKYVLLSSGQSISLESCEDIRFLYNDLVLNEVIQEKQGNLPDGLLFRAGTVNVYDGAGQSIHSGVYPEEKITQLIEESLRILNDESIETIVRAALFHYLFGYIHPFYDGNGRMNRFISSYVVAQEYEPIISLRLSYSIKENIQKYYGAYMTCEHILNRGDLTPFVIAFCEIVVAAMKNILESLSERKESLDLCKRRIKELPECQDENVFDVGYALVTATLFSAYGLTAVQLGDIFGVSRQTIYKRLEPFKETGLLLQRKVGRRTYYTLSLENLNTQR